MDHQAANELAQLRASERRLRRFIASLSHEIRTPLSGVLGLTELLADSALTPTQRDHVDTLRAAANSLLSLINNVLDLSKIEAGKVTLDATDCHLPRLVNETVALFGTAAFAKGIDLRGDFHVSTPEWVRIDTTRVTQILGNLVANAVKFTERGEVTVGTRGVEDRIVFTVTDTGIGIAPEDHERLMWPFEQGDVSTTRIFGGTGLGLAICRELAGLMHGTISVDSVLGRGTTFTVDLPYAPGVPITPAAAPRSDATEPTSAGRVLLADDTPVNQLVARAMLEKSGWTVVTVDNGQEAVAALAADSYDVVILDCQMPVLDGFSAARAIRQMPDAKSRVPILAMTASALPEDRRRCLDAGMDEYVSKPISRDLLDAAMQRVLVTRAAS